LGTLVIGIICLGFSALLPVIGWLVLVLLLVAGLGAALLVLLQRNGAVPTEAKPDASTDLAESEVRVE
jgi:hypothetical protein